MSTKNFITGLYGCDCHPFASWEECEAANKQKLSFGTRVQNRHTGQQGTIEEVKPDKGFVIVKYGRLQSDLHLEHVQQLIKL